MDLLAMWRLLARHKMVSAVASLGVIGVLVATILIAPPVYRASSSVVLLSPPPPQADPRTELIDPRDQNPYVAFGDLSIVVDILRRVMSGTGVADQLADDGVTGPFTVAANVDFLRGPIIDVATEARTVAEARRANERVTDVLLAELAALQERQGTNPTFWITAETVVPATRATRLYSSVARRLIVVAAVGMGAVFGLVLLTDAVSRRLPARAPALTVPKLRRGGRPGRLTSLLPLERSELSDPVAHNR